MPKVIAVASERLVPLGFVFFRAESRRAGRKAQMINYTIDPKIHSYLGNRKDGLAIDGKAF